MCGTCASKFSMWHMWWCLAAPLQYRYTYCSRWFPQKRTNQKVHYMRNMCVHVCNWVVTCSSVTISIHKNGFNDFRTCNGSDRALGAEHFRPCLPCGGSSHFRRWPCDGGLQRRNNVYTRKLFSMISEDVNKPQVNSLCAECFRPC